MMRIAKARGWAAWIVPLMLVRCSFWDLEALDQTRDRVDAIAEAGAGARDALASDDDGANVVARDGSPTGALDAASYTGPDGSRALPGNDASDGLSRDSTSAAIADSTVAEAGTGATESGSAAAVDGRAGDASDASADSAATAGSAECDATKPFGVPVMVTGLQSSSREAGLHLFADELTGFFWEGPLGATSLYVTQRADKASSFGSASLLSNTSSSAAQYDPSASGDGLKLVFRANTPGSAGGDDLYWASRTSTGNDFGNAMGLASLNTGYSEVQPFLMPDASELYFSANPTGDYDIYHSIATGPAAFVTPTTVKEVNVAGVADQNPTLTADGLTMVLSSTRGGGQGGQDVWIAQRASKTSSFGLPVALAPVNSSANDYPSWMSADRCRLYMYSDRSGVLRIYLAQRPR